MEKETVSQSILVSFRALYLCFINSYRIMKHVIVLLLAFVFLNSCQIREEIIFQADGSGSYEIGLDMSEMMKMGEDQDSIPPKDIDTLINFATFLELKKDSIASLSNEEQKKLELLRPLQFAMKMNDEEKQMDMRLAYAFTKIDDIAKFADAVKKADIKELKKAMDPIVGAEQDSVGEDKGMDALFSMAKSFHTVFSAQGFSRKATDEAIAEMTMKKDTTLKSDDPFADMIRFKQVYRFPYRIKSVSNKNAKILSDFKGVELEANMYEMNNDPEFFNIEVVFEK